jgi:hypothetical protein
MVDCQNISEQSLNNKSTYRGNDGTQRHIAIMAAVAAAMGGLRALLLGIDPSRDCFEE